ncbi:hypothetical protein [Pseudomonas tohonis]|uniref:hypothetical protein n=1 Tax=Pseudomonas tohonis TaxID=2725477 RepID=UPI0022EFDCB5|nr:hypothetical protein [Pseudomonas tohonis]
MKKRYTLDQDVICHIFKSGKHANNLSEPNDGAGGHATHDIKSKITEYTILAVPQAKQGELAGWAGKTLSERILCPYPHVATFKIGTQSYNSKSMFPGTGTKAELIKTIERALTSGTSAHTYNGSAKVNAASGRAWVAPADFKRPLSDMTTENGDYVVGRANGLRIKGQKKGAGGAGLTSAFPDTTGFYWG